MTAGAAALSTVAEEGGAQELSPFYIESEGSPVERPRRTLKHGELFGVFDIRGDLGASDDIADGLFFQDTRFLSHLELRIEGRQPVLLDSVVLDDNTALLVDLTNPDMCDPAGHIGLQSSTIFTHRAKVLHERACHERITLRNFGAHPLSVAIELRFGADFRDLFEVRGEDRPRRGTQHAELPSDSCVRYSYRGLDQVTRTTTIDLSPAPAQLTSAGARWRIELDAGGRAAISCAVSCAIDEREHADAASFLQAYRSTRRAMRMQGARLDTMTSSNERFAVVASRSAYDLAMLLTETEHGVYPFAGVPWYSTIFGRDGIITAMELMSVAPWVARGVLTTLAATQATEHDAASDAQPGKILHETRGGEMARTGEVPFQRYYGTVDATPLFVMLAGQYLERTGDLETAHDIWPNILAALDWIDTHGDADGDGFVEYHRQTDKGLANQGWKDSHDAIMHADGAMAAGPIALVEVQGYVFAARLAAAALARGLGEYERAAELEEGAEALRRRFEDAFWMEDRGFYALALDGAKRPCRVLASNAGHALFTGIAAAHRAAAVARKLMGRRFFSGWGVRTLAQGEARYNPMSYHNGSVWPHDNAMIALGLARYGFKAEAARVAEGLFAAASYDELDRLPELFCGFPRRPRRGPTAYPVACSPQAWAAAAPYALIAACLGLELDHAADVACFTRPKLPRGLDELTLTDLRLGTSRLRLGLRRSGSDVTVSVDERHGSAQIMLLK